MRNVQPYLVGALFIAAGALHFKIPETYERIVPSYLPAHRELVLASGAFEILGGLGVLPRATRRAAGIGLIALLLAVFPANIYMATESAAFATVAPAWALWARLPLQFALMWWVAATTFAAPRDGAA